MKALSQAEIDRIAAQGRELLRQKRAKEAPPEVVNLGPALELHEPIPLLWNGEEYRVKPISYREGLKLQRAALRLDAQNKAPAQTEEEIAVLDAFLVELEGLFHSLLEPQPEENPFTDLAPQEVGALLGYFIWCLTKQSARRSLPRLGRHPSTTH